LFTYLVLYLQQQLGYSAAQTGVRFLALTAAMFVASTVAGRLSHAVPVRLMISGGFVLIGGGVLLMTGLTSSSSWTHLLPGMIVSGAGAGLVTVPLASTAVGVVDISRAGMASGINATARQVGLATGIAALGSIFAARTAQAGFVAGLNRILAIGAAVAFASALLSLVLIRGRDFVPPPAAAQRGDGPQPATAGAAAEGGK
jgi:predicted MFS family arabinose efflux permease